MNKTIKIVLGLAITIYIIYFRLIFNRTPRELYENINVYYIILYFIITVMMLILFLSNIIKLFHKINNNTIKNESMILEYLYKIYSNQLNPLIYWSKSLIAFDAFIKNNTFQYDSRKTYADHIIERIGLLLSTYNRLSIPLLTILHILPQLIVCISFFIDVIIQNKFFYFYKTLWLLIIPMLISYLIYSIAQNLMTNIESLNETLLIVADNNEIITIYDWFNITKKSMKEETQVVCAICLKEEIVNPQENQIILDYIIKCMNLYYTLHNYMEQYSFYKEYIDYFFNSLKYLIYSSCWFYILFYGISFI